MVYDPYSIILVPFPFTDKNHKKKRPALIISSTKHQQQTGHTTVLMITTAKKSSWPSDYSIKSLSSTGLHSTSIIRQKIFTIDSRLIIKWLGKLASVDKNEIMKHIHHHLAL